MENSTSKQLYQKALTYFPGGVNSPVRAFKSVGGDPIFIKRGEGCKIWDEDDNEYVDFCGSWGPLIHGHAHPHIVDNVSKAIQNGLSFGAPTQLENQLADLILENIEFVDKIRFVSSGTEAVMSAIRLARGHTKRNKIIKFEGCYHGHADSMLVKAGSGLATFGISSSAGVPSSVADDTIVLPLNNMESIEEAFANHKDNIACIIIEPVPANNGLLIQDPEYLAFLKTQCTKHGALLIFDEVITGFRLGFTGAAGYYGIYPDIVTYGKIIGGGMPVGAYASSNSIMNNISPVGNVYQAGTLSGNPIAMAAGKAQLEACLSEEFYDELNDHASYFVDLIQDHITQNNYNLDIIRLGSIFWLSFSKTKIKRADEIDPAGMELFELLYKQLLNCGIYLGPSGYEVGFVSSAHSKDVLKEAAASICKSLDQVYKPTK